MRCAEIGPHAPDSAGDIAHVSVKDSIQSLGDEQIDRAPALRARCGTASSAQTLARICAGSDVARIKGLAVPPNDAGFVVRVAPLRSTSSRATGRSARRGSGGWCARPCQRRKSQFQVLTRCHVRPIIERPCNIDGVIDRPRDLLRTCVCGKNKRRLSVDPAPRPAARESRRT